MLPAPEPQAILGDALANVGFDLRLKLNVQDAAPSIRLPNFPYQIGMAGHGWEFW
jgi:hypothetical protein